MAQGAYDALADWGAPLLIGVHPCRQPRLRPDKAQKFQTVTLENANTWRRFARQRYVWTCARSPLVKPKELWELRSAPAPLILMAVQALDLE